MFFFVKFPCLGFWLHQAELQREFRSERKSEVVLVANSSSHKKKRTRDILNISSSLSYLCPKFILPWSSHNCCLNMMQCVKLTFIVDWLSKQRDLVKISLKTSKDFRLTAKRPNNQRSQFTELTDNFKVNLKWFSEPISSQCTIVSASKISTVMY